MRWGFLAHMIPFAPLAAQAQEDPAAPSAEETEQTGETAPSSDVETDEESSGAALKEAEYPDSASLPATTEAKPQADVMAESDPPDHDAGKVPNQPEDDANSPEVAAPLEDPLERESLLPEIHGFVSQGFIKTSRHNYLARSERGSFEFAEVGINFTKQLSERLRVGMQLFVRDLGPVGNYKPQFDWFYLDYLFFDWLGLRAGRTKIPFGLYNEINDVDAARVPVLLPQSVYPTENRDYLLAQTGLELYGRIPLSVLGDLEYRGYGGTIFLDTSDATTVNNFDVPYVVGGRLMWETPLEGLRGGGTVQALSLDGDFVLTPEILQAYQDQGVLPTDASNLIPFRIPALLWVTSIEYAIHDLQLAAEYGRWHVRIRSDFPDIVPPTETTNERFYVMGSYRVARWFAPGAYYSVLFPNIEQRSGRESQWHDVALTLRFDMSDHWLFKLEGHYMEGTAGLRSALNDNVPLTDLAPTWGLLLAKTTAYF